ncbi:putative aldouronate transport system permease protein [Paenibacillus cellulosilyticus]|uniref:Putative aldouronate transport system permease protein n=1 Tax=Paenibacillus cellulosilyticus TaxID=375489 RepID=A0A2V2YZE7_9BACL|nr:carbohydrate ABC transporter permease [Paenibacillus cellulosilyticus]PWW07292.1 putative aldouronate transport system permease protein [Paenibacillus cellulosilyticus]QKS44521.1 carbohydrate ABC transporter permease [Paenibacillus cellulosilyticus]
MVQDRSLSRRAFLVFNYIFLLLTSVLCILPFVNLLAVSFSGSAAVSAGEVAFWPVDFTTKAYEFALSGDRFITALWVSVERVILGTAVNLILLVLTAYPLSKTKSKVMGRNLYMAFFMITMLFNGGLIPTYLVVVKTGLINSIWALILPGALPVFSMIILMNFIRGLPEEIEESAVIDGAGPLQVLVRILLPLLKPALATVGLFSIVGHWNSWFDGIIYMNDMSKYPIQSYLQTLLLNFDEIMMKSGTDYTELLSKMNARTGRAAELFLGALPILAVYPFLQKYFTTGLVLGSVKG